MTNPGTQPSSSSCSLFSYLSFFLLLVLLLLLLLRPRFLSFLLSPSRLPPLRQARGNDIYLSGPPIHRGNPRPFIISAVFFFTTRTGRQIFPGLGEDNRPHATTNHGLLLRLSAHVHTHTHTRGESKFGTMASVYLQERRSTPRPSFV